MKRCALPALSAAILAAVCLPPADAAARTQATISYPYDKVWPTTVRLLRIDEGFRISEKDADAGYVLFEFDEDGYVFRGSFEIAKVRDQDGRNASRVIVQIQDRPAYMEQGLIDRLTLKLRRELGEPAPPPPPPPEPKRPKNGKDKTPKQGPEDTPADTAENQRESAAAAAPQQRNHRRGRPT